MFTEVFQADLLPAETLLWTGQPSTQVIFHKQDTYVVPFTALLAFHSTLWLAVDLHLLGPPAYRGMAVNPYSVFWQSIYFLIGQYLLWGRFLVLRWKKKHIYYAVTNKRVLILHDYGHRELLALPMDSIPLIKKAVRADGNGTIRFGKPPEEGTWNYPRIHTDAFQKSGVPTFGDIDGAEQVYQLVAEQRDRAMIRASGMQHTGRTVPKSS